MRGWSYATDISLAGIPARAPSMLLDTIRVGPNTYMGVSRPCDEAMAAPSSVSPLFSKICINIVTEILDRYNRKIRYPEVKVNPDTRHT